MTKVLPPDIGQAIPIPAEDANISINVGLDGVWLNFTSAMGLHASINVNNLKNGSIAGAAISQWCLDRQEQACDIYALLPEEARAKPHDYLKREYAMSYEAMHDALTKNLELTTRLTTLVERLAAFVNLPPDDTTLLAADNAKAPASGSDLSVQSAGGGPAREPVTESNPA